MDSGNKFLAIACVVIVAFILQVVLVIASNKQRPSDAAVDFSKAYFMLDEDMARSLCSEINENEEVDVVGEYLQRVADDARANGFGVNWMKMALSHIETKTEMVDDNTAEVNITCRRRRSINPIFAIVAKIFSLGETYHVEDTLTVVNEDGQWKVCGQPFDLIES